MSHLGEKYRRNKILIADDDAVSRLFCSQALALPDAALLVAKSGRSAIRMAAEHLPNIVVMDAYLQDMSGVDAIAVIRQQWPCFCAAPCFVGMTADDSAAMVLAMQAAGCERVLTKPFSSLALAECVRDPRPGSAASAASGTTTGAAKALQQLQTTFDCSLADQFAELDRAVSLLDWVTAERIVHRLSGAAAMAGHSEIAQTGRALLRCIPPAGSAAIVADSYLAFLQRLAEVRSG